MGQGPDGREMINKDLDALREQTMHPEPGVRFEARRLYHERRPPTSDVGSVENLSAQLEDPSPEVRWRAARRCQRLDDYELIQQAINRLAVDPDAWVRAELVRVAARRGFGAAAVLARCLRDIDERVRSNALEAFFDMPNALPIADAEAIARAHHHRARGAALVALAKNGVDVLAAVWTMLNSPEPWFRATGEYVIRTLQHRGRTPGACGA